MPKIMFENQQNLRSENYNASREENFRFERRNHFNSQSEKAFRKEYCREDDRCFDKFSDHHKEKKNTGRKTKEKHDFPLWVAISLFSLLGAFALFTPLLEKGMPYEGTYVSMSFTGFDVVKMLFENSESYKNGNKLWTYIATMVAFTASMAASIIMKEKINELPLIPTAAGVVAIAGIFITFGYEAIVSSIRDCHGICLAIQLVCALMLIALNIIPLKNMIEQKSRNTSKRRTF